MIGRNFKGDLGVRRERESEELNPVWMDWWNSLEKAGNISKLAYSALKNAQQKIDAVLDIQETEEQQHSPWKSFKPSDVISPCDGTVVLFKDSEEKQIPVDPLNRGKDSDDHQLDELVPVETSSSEVAYALKQQEELTVGGIPTREPSVDETQPTQVGSTTPPNLPSPSTIKVGRFSPVGSSIETLSVTSQDLPQLHKSCSESDLSCKNLLSLDSQPSNRRGVSAEDDIETTTTGSDIEVISCCTSTNGELLPVLPHASVHRITQNKSMKIQPDCSHMTETLPARTSDTGILISNTLRGHRRAVSQEYRFSHGTPNEDDISFAFQRLSKVSDFGLALRTAPPSDVNSSLHNAWSSVCGTALPINQWMLDKTLTVPEHRRGVPVGPEQNSNLSYQRYEEKKHLLSIRESKILQLSKENSELRDANALLLSQLKNGQLSQDLSALSTEFSQRLAKTEMQLRMLTRERDQLKTSLAAAQSRLMSAKQTSQSSLTSNEEALLKRIAELERSLLGKTTQLEDLLKEGERMAQEQLATNNLVKKLRASLKETKESERTQSAKIERLNMKIQHLQDECETKDGTIKDQAAQLNHLHKLTQTQESEWEHLKVQLLHSESKVKAQDEEMVKLKRELSAIQDDLTKTQSLAESEARATENEQSLRESCRQLQSQLDSLRTENSALKSNHERQAQQWREERIYYQNLVAERNSRIEHLEEMATSAAKPALVQLQAVEASLSNQTVAWEQAERNLNLRLVEAQRELAVAKQCESERVEKLKQAELRSSSLERRNTKLVMEQSTLLEELSQVQTSLDHYKQSEQRLSSEVSKLQERLEKQETHTAGLDASLKFEQNRCQSLFKENQQLHLQVKHLRNPASTDLTSQLSVESQLEQHNPTSPASSTNRRPQIVGSVLQTSPNTGSPSPGTVNAVTLSSSSNSQTVIEYMQVCLKLTA
ncbi:hypothetical protein T265_04423 [Opisthorchis viverrini]|uniref:TATA element modulatory factor 1 TATA binding domain-containing protein n=1 Tax=Opisthorchis viverrini TaxID=6198 RepID=A0A074ZNX8_OPIVI|nr:hypothetical protein T265_04423 [Opisthorchis viverrini]KER28816.1 hypothetical protein T265_04423 [Opisthorchis viverrini]